MNKRIKIILIIASILILLGINNVFAASGSFSVNKATATIEIGSTTTFTITATDCGGKFSITSSNTSVATVSSKEEWIESSLKEVTITAKAAGTATITIKAEDVSSTDEEEVTGSKTITITVAEKQSNNNSNPSTGNESNNNTQTQPPATTTLTKSSEAKLRTFGIKPDEYDFSGFSKNRDKEEWSTTVPNDVAEVEVYATPLDSKATVKGTGKISLKEGNNTAKVTVTAEDGKTTKTYTLTIKRNTAVEEEEKAGVATLSQLGIKPEEYDFSGFKSDKIQYSAEVPNEVKEIEVYAKATDSKAQITGTGMIELKEGENELKVEVIAQNGTKQTYTINVTRKEAEEAAVVEKFGLSSLSIEGLKLTPSFMSGTYEYTVELTEDVSSLEINAKATDKKATVEIVGNENLQEGEKTITILVQNEDTKESATYQIIVNKSIQKQEVIQTSWLKPSTWGKEEKIKLAIIVVLIILIISAIILKIKISKEKDPKNKIDLPGADELDKAITEHQELTDENSPTTGESSINSIEAQDRVEEDVISNEVDKNQLEKNINNYSEQNYIEDIAKDRLGINDNFDDKPKRRGKHF